MIRNFFGQRNCSADCVVRPAHSDRVHSSASKFNTLEVNKVKGLVVLNKTYQPFSIMSPCTDCIFYFNLAQCGFRVRWKDVYLISFENENKLNSF